MVIARFAGTDLSPDCRRKDVEKNAASRDLRGGLTTVGPIRPCWEADPRPPLGWEADGGGPGNTGPLFLCQAARRVSQQSPVAIVDSADLNFLRQKSQPDLPRGAGF